MTSLQLLPTHFAPAERASTATLQKQYGVIFSQTALTSVLDSIPDIVMVLNQQRQVAYCNQALLNFLQLTDSRSVIGRRPGELLSCIRHLETGYGCGTTEFCSACGAVRAILASQQGVHSVEECRITRLVDGQAESLDLRVHAKPFECLGESFTVFTMTDIGDEKRRKVLERIFFHDVLNVAGGLQLASEIICQSPPSHLTEVAQSMHQLVLRLINEVETQRELVAAESSELKVNALLMNSLAFLNHIVLLYQAHPAANCHILRIAEQAQEVTFSCDATLLGRIIGNLVKNALEATPPGETITLGCQVEGEQIRFWVHNPGVMPREVQLQVFQRSFSTKSPHRGLGTYSVKLLSERYLQGKVWFTSTPEAGTTFVGAYPLEPERYPEPNEPF